MDLYFDDVVQGFFYAEAVFRTWCITDIKKIEAEVKKALWQMLPCIYEHDEYIIRRRGRHAAMFEHECQKHPACNMYWKHFLSKLPLASKLNRTELLIIVSQDDLWEFTKLFMEPWMRQFCNFDELDTYCLLVLLENVSSFHQDSNPSRHALYQENIGKTRKLAEACLYAKREDISSKDKDMCLQIIINALALVKNWEADCAIQQIKDVKSMFSCSSFIKQSVERGKQEKEELYQKILAFKRGIPLETNDSLATLKADTTVKAKLDIAKGDQGTGHEIEPHDRDKDLMMRVVITRSNLDTLFIRHAQSSKDEYDRRMMRTTT